MAGFMSRPVAMVRRWRRTIEVGVIAVLGAMVGLATVLLGDVTAEFLETLVTTTVTIYGFLIIGLIFIYEQQRRSWPVMFSIRDPERAALRSGLWIGITTGATSLILGVTLIAVGGSDERTPWKQLGLQESDADRLIAILDAVAWIVAPLAVTSIVVLIHAGRTVLVLLSPRSISDRVVQAARRAARSASDDEVSKWVDTLQLLTIEHLVSRNMEQYQEHVRSLGMLAEPLSPSGDARRDGMLAWFAIDRLITVADRASAERDPRIAALTCALDVVVRPGVLVSVSPSRRVALAERVAPMLDEVLSTTRPSATVSALLLRLGLILHPTEADRAGLLVDALRASLPITNPADVWSAISGVFLEEATGGRSGMQPIELAEAVNAMSSAPLTDDDVVRPRMGAADRRSQAERVIDLFNALGIGSADSDVHVPAAKGVALLGAYTWILADASGHATIDAETRRALLHRFARRWREQKADLKQELPEPLHFLITRLVPTDWLYVRFMAGIIANLEAGRTGPGSTVVQARNFLEEVTPTVDEVGSAVRMVLLTFSDPGMARAAVEFVRGMLWRDGLAGMMALPTFLLIRSAVEALFLAIRTDSDLSAFQSSEMFIDISEKATAPQYFNRGLADCRDLCYEEVRAALNVLTGQLPTVTHEPIGGERLRQARGLFRALGIATFGLAVAIDDADGLVLVGRFVEAVPWFAQRSEQGDHEWTRPQLLRLANDAIWLTNIIMDQPIRIAPKKAGIRRDDVDDADTSSALKGHTYVRLPDGTQALRLRDVWRLAALRIVLHDICALIAARAELDGDRDLSALALELQDAVSLGAGPASEERIDPDRIEELLAEAVVSVRRYHHWHWSEVIRRLDWDRLGPAVWAAAIERLQVADGDPIEPTGVMGLMVQLTNRLDADRMPNEARMFVAEVLQRDLPELGSIDGDELFPTARVCGIIVKALIIVTHEQVYDKRVHDGALLECLEWAGRTGQHAFAWQLVQHLRRRSEHNPLLLALRRAMETSPHLGLWRWPQWRRLKTLDLRQVGQRLAQVELGRLGVGARVKADVEKVEEKYAIVRFSGVAGILPVSEAGWTNIPDLRMVLASGDEIELEVVPSRPRNGVDPSDDPGLVLSRKPVVGNARPAVRAAMKKRSRQDACFLGRHPDGRALVRLTAFEGWVVAGLDDVASDVMPAVGSLMRVIITACDNWGRIRVCT